MGESEAPARTREDEDTGTSESDEQSAEDSSALSAGPQEPRRGLSWPSRPQEIAIASIGGVGALIAGSVLGGAGTSVESLERWSLAFCGLSGLLTWFLPRPKSSPELIRLGTWAAVALALFVLEPIHIALYRAEHDLAQGTRSEKVAAIERLVRLGDRDLHGADLRELNLSDADLTNVRLTKANLTHSMLERALLLESDLGGAKLSGASFRGANLSSANLRAAELGKGHDAARCDRFTQLPPGFDCYHGAIVVRDSGTR